MLVHQLAKSRVNRQNAGLPISKTKIESTIVGSNRLIDVTTIVTIRLTNRQNHNLIDEMSVHEQAKSRLNQQKAGLPISKIPTQSLKRWF